MKTWTDPRCVRGAVCVCGFEGRGHVMVGASVIGWVLSLCHFFFFWASCSSLSAAAFSGSTLRRLFKSSTQALTFCSSL